MGEDTNSDSTDSSAIEQKIDFLAPDIDPLFDTEFFFELLHQAITEGRLTEERVRKRLNAVDRQLALRRDRLTNETVLALVKAVESQASKNPDDRIIKESVERFVSQHERDRQMIASQITELEAHRRLLTQALEDYFS